MIEQNHETLVRMKRMYLIKKTKINPTETLISSNNQKTFWKHFLTSKTFYIWPQKNTITTPPHCRYLGTGCPGEIQTRPLRRRSHHAELCGFGGHQEFLGSAREGGEKVVGCWVFFCKKKLFFPGVYWGFLVFVVVVVVVVVVSKCFPGFSRILLFVFPKFV